MKPAPMVQQPKYSAGSVCQGLARKRNVHGSASLHERSSMTLIQELRVTGYHDGIEPPTHDTADRHHVLVIL
jgi:hypothetical protein